jgi:hypothetical protein
VLNVDNTCEFGVLHPRAVSMNCSLLKVSREYGKCCVRTLSTSSGGSVWSLIVVSILGA